MGIRVSSLAWIQQPGAAIDIGVGDYGSSVWVIGSDPVPGGYGIFYWKGDQEWAGVDGGAIGISGGGAPWIVNSEGTIFSSQIAVVDWPVPVISG
jgi:hypothetical protein